ncbi:hypothetical protein L3Q82_004212 [Scortum barcoo]|uniref:Uncharacterized protein n=1 Tax=Scortum barcoo TaxID=214431 RepID=A0ACB8VJQ3_9TELE|nr:hypothetical protein L3Q82_004212 [Scortum barcoo]
MSLGWPGNASGSPRKSWRKCLGSPRSRKAIRPGRLQTSPVALTSHVMKVLERLVLAQLRPQVPFNTIQPLLLGEKLQVMGVDDSMISWITDYLTGRPQFVRLGSVLSDVVNHLRLNVNKTREMVIDFRRKKMPSQPLRIRGEVVEEVEDYKYLGVVIDNRLDCKSNTEAVYKKGMSRLYFLRRLRSFNVGSRMLEIFYQSVVASMHHFLCCRVLGQQHHQSQQH